MLAGFCDTSSMNASVWWESEQLTEETISVTFMAALHWEEKLQGILFGNNFPIIFKDWHGMNCYVNGLFLLSFQALEATVKANRLVRKNKKWNTKRSWQAVYQRQQETIMMMMLRWSRLHALARSLVVNQERNNFQRSILLLCRWWKVFFHY